MERGGARVDREPPGSLRAGGPLPYAVHDGRKHGLRRAGAAGAARSNPATSAQPARSTAGEGAGGPCWRRALDTRHGLHTYPTMLDVKPRPRTQAPPATRWRNYYRVYHVLTLARLGPIFPGIHAGPDAFPSKEIAEQHASNFLALLNPPGRWLMDHAGAYPEGEKAN